MSSSAKPADYHVASRGQTVGVMPLEKLLQMRETGQLTGDELVWREGMDAWRPLAEILSPPPLPSGLRAPIPAPKESKAWIGWVVGGAVTVLLCIAFVVGWAWRLVNSTLTSVSAPQTWASGGGTDGIELAGAIPPAPNARTIASRLPSERAFRERHYLEGYLRDGRRSTSDAADEQLFVQRWIDINFGETSPEQRREWIELGNKLVAAPESRDAIILMTLAINGFTPADTGRAEWMEKMLGAFEGSAHRPYPRVCASTHVVSALPKGSARIREIDTKAVELLREAVVGGTLTPDEQEILGDNLIGGWGEAFFHRNREEVCAIFEQADKEWRWLALLLSGERHIDNAWAARGSGYANTVTEAGWEGFRHGLENARRDFTIAWRMEPDRPLSSARMIAVAMGQSQERDMRIWFERALAAQVDHRQAWAAMRWALRPRWFGSQEAMLALGVSAVDTGRFETDAPRQLIDAILDLEREAELPEGRRLFGRADIWPHVRRMYEGYLAEPSQAHHRDGWRTAYASAAYLAGEYSDAAAQLEKLDWKPLPGPLSGWNADLSRMHIEVAARTGTQARQVAEAENLRAQGETARAKERYEAILRETADPRTAEWVRFRVESL